MAEIEHFASAAGPRVWPRRDEIVHPMLLCAMVAAVEGFGAFGVTFGVALLYHVLALNESLLEFNTLFYGGYGLVTGGLYAIFAAIGCGQFLTRRSIVHTGPHEAFYSWTAALSITLLAAFLVGNAGDLSRVSLTSAFLVGVPLTYGLKTGLRRMLSNRLRAGGLHFATLALIGDRTSVARFLSNGDLDGQGHRLTDTLYLEHARTGATGTLRADVISAFAAKSLARGTDQIVFVGAIDLDELDVIINELKRYSLNLLYAPASQTRRLKLLDVVAIGPNNAVRFVRAPMSDTAVLLKRTVDVVLSALALLLLSPLMVLAALAIKLDTPGPVIFRQERRGFNGQTFMIWKFRSMSVTESGYGMTQATRGDSRVTRVGRILRASSIDELPQLVNVLTGHMSLVGPRPHAISHDESLSRQLADYAHRQRIKPGITGWAQVSGFRGETVNTRQIEGRVAHDIHYIDHWSIYLDLWIMLRTAIAVVFQRDAY